MKNLPDSWLRVKITEILEANNNGKPFQQGWSPRCENFPAPKEKWGVLKTTSVQSGKFWDHENKSLPDHLEPRPHLEVKLGDVLMTCAGPRARCGVVCLVERTRSKLMMSGKIYRFRPHPEAMHPKYLSYLIQTAEAQREIDQMKTGINDSGLNLTHSRFAALKVVVAPLEEQHRIVAKIEELFSELDKAVESLKKVREQLAVYRQSVLKHAFEGKLTAQWREENKDKLEKPEQLLARVKQESEARYDQQLQKWKAAVKKWEEGGKSGKRPAKPKQNSVVVPIDRDLFEELPHIPSSWEWLFLKYVGRIETGTTPSKKNPENYGGQLPFFKPTDLRQGSHVRNAREHLSQLGEEYARVLPAGSTLVTCIGATIGKTGFAVTRCATNQQINSISPSPGFNQKFVYFQMLAPFLNGKVKSDASATTLPILNKSKFRKLPFVFCSIPEQDELVRLVEERFVVTERSEREINATLKQAETLRRATLMKAFTGQLVPQDPNDEPATILLKRIKAEKTAHSQKNTRAKRRRTAAVT